jgi:hypothetical protein
LGELRNCPLCSSLFTFKGASTLCPQCTGVADLEYFQVREYIFSHPGSNTLEVAAATGVKEEVILRFLREGRLSLKGQI